MQIPNQFLNSIFTNNNDIFEMFKHKIDALKNESKNKKEYQVSNLKLAQIFSTLMYRNKNRTSLNEIKDYSGNSHLKGVSSTHRAKELLISCNMIIQKEIKRGTSLYYEVNPDILKEYKDFNINKMNLMKVNINQ